jgi:hypothetical protein
MNVEQLIEVATDRASSADFGPDGWREPLEVLTMSITKEAGLNELGREVTAQRIVDYLVTRLEIEKCFANNPEIANEVIERPVFGLGLPRTGSTVLSYLLSLDAAHRSVPPPETATQYSDPRIAAADAEISFINEMFPDFVGMLPTSATGPQECLLLMALDFRSQMFEATAKIPSYSEYLAACDMTSTYQYHRRVLQLLQWRCPPNKWWLKTPAHMQHIEELNAVYPDAIFVMTHRDITKVIPSVCALMAALSSPLTESPDPKYFGRMTCQEWEQSLRRLMAFRDAGNEHRFHDIQFSDFQGDPVGTIGTLYDFLGEPLLPKVAALMHQWWKDNSVDRAGAKAYAASEFGLDLDEIRRQFGFYGERFAVPDGR